jgi:hypothetical protein
MRRTVEFIITSKYREPGRWEVFAEVYEHTKCLQLEDIALNAAGFGKVDLVETRKERYGMRAFLVPEGD